MKPFTSKHMFGACSDNSSPLKQDKPKKTLKKITPPPTTPVKPKTVNPKTTKKTEPNPTKSNPKTKEAYANISSKSATRMDEEIQENKKRVLLEGVAKGDSVTAARFRKLSGGTLKQQQAAGNKAANKTRKAGGGDDMTVLRGKSTGSGGFLSEGEVVYTRDKPVIRDFTKLRQDKKTRKY